MGFNDLVWSVFQGYKDYKEKNIDKKFQDLNRSWDCWIGEAHTRLYEVDELNQAETDDHYNAILDHLYRHDATRVDCFKEIENEIIKRMW
jgi:hypothetical protein